MAKYTVKRGTAVGKTCSTQGCAQPVHAREFCRKHYIHERHRGMPPIQPPTKHFWDAVRKTENPDECWVWIRSCVPSGYGKIYYKSRTALAHRVSYELTHGDIPDGLDVLHSCDNPPCCNPKHLFLGTQKDNMDDMRKKGRQRYLRGEDVATAKIREADVQRILRLRELGLTLLELSKIYDICESRLSKIINRKAWVS